MKAVVVYESLWGNTAAVARAIADGIGEGTIAKATDEITAEEAGTADLIVAGAPVLGFRLGNDQILRAIARDEADAPSPPDLSHPSLRSWLESLPAGDGKCAAFETRIWWSPRGATGDIESRLTRSGYPPIARPERFIVKDKYGPLKDGEIERARRWGAELGRLVREITSRRALVTA
jgi:hypothetical protein